jgi:hypothetical protein
MSGANLTRLYFNGDNLCWKLYIGGQFFLKKIVLDKKFIWFCLKENFHGEKKDLKKPILCFYADWPHPRVDYTERRKTKRKKEND